jgi:hypothetical protein
MRTDEQRKQNDDQKERKRERGEICPQIKIFGQMGAYPAVL